MVDLSGEPKFRFSNGPCMVRGQCPLDRVGLHDYAMAKLAQEFEGRPIPGPRYLRWHREFWKLTQEQAAECVHVPLATYRTWEAGTATPSVQECHKLASGLRMSWRELLRFFQPAQYQKLFGGS